MSSNTGAENPLESPSPPSSPEDAPAFLTSPLGNVNAPDAASPPSVANMTTSSTPLGATHAARRPPGAAVPARATATPMSADIAAKMKAFSLSRAGAPRPSPQTTNSAAPAPAGPGGIPAGFKLPAGLGRPGVPSMNSSPAVPAKAPSMAERRGLKLGGLPGQAPAANGPAAGRQKPKMTLSQMAPAPTNSNGEEKPKDQSAMEKYKDYIDTNRGAIRFPGKAVIHGGGVEFANGRSFNIGLDELDTMDELGKGNYGTVFKARHARPKIRKVGQGLAGNKARSALDEETQEQVPAGTSGVVMAIKEMRLELDDAKLAAIIMELDVLHRCISPFIVEFYGAFFQEGAVYICMEWMDGGSIDKIYGDGVPEGVLRKITLATVQGLKSLKEEHNIIHRDVKPTNILMNTRGHVKICDFGVSGNLVASIAKTNIGCQSYMAPERISSGGLAQAGATGTYNVQSDIWSLGLTIIESALGRYPYPPETYDNIFSQLAAIVDGEPPDLPADKFSVEARDFVRGCLNKIPKLRPTYPRLLEHPWLAELLKPSVIAEEDEEAAERAYAAGESIAQTGPTADTGFFDREVGEWVIAALEKKKAGKLGKSAKPALHAVALDAVSPHEIGEDAQPATIQP
ncbi:hypothetical protein AMS68_001803 [Peltaster fructicola]|uniref:mitogen-activated protein kinase kinase n=1 Tax=Peltaster fructicola TaxID=286661 RepID=A0A6H0XNL4_9PEZI|nr:hypothetical protein AMS68_001803 [Peltaster fructicola]